MRRKLFTVYSVLVMVCLIISPVAGVCGNEKVSMPFQYSGYSYPDYNSYTRSSQYVTVSDGTKLALTWYLPSQGPSEGPFPIIFHYLPYHRENINPDTGELITAIAQGTMEFFISYGYGVVVADMHGSGASFGSKVDWSPPLARDGKELIDWIADQSWCDGNVGMVGGSVISCMVPVCYSRTKAGSADINMLNFNYQNRIIYNKKCFFWHRFCVNNISNIQNQLICA
ncbi:MAG: CocE/NonD family hydrolase [Desulfobacteraceae bacterium]|nr:CocE/NonD family hydrolase [Desulfobacteraceae bacterium]